MKTRMSVQLQLDWISTLVTGNNPEGLYRLSLAVRQRLIPQEMLEIGRDITHCRARQASLSRDHQSPNNSPVERADIRRRHDREVAKEVVLRAQRLALGRACAGMLVHKIGDQVLVGSIAPANYDGLPVHKVEVRSPARAAMPAKSPLERRGWSRV